MLWQRFESESLAHYSYLAGEAGEAFVVDPQRDVDTYEQVLAQAGYRLRFILETHRYEDLLLGSAELADRTGADVWHADGHLDYRYGSAVEDGQQWEVGGLRLRALATPGHTPGHVSYVLDRGSGRGGARSDAWMVFCGDCLLPGTPGRTDLLGLDALDKQTRDLHASLHTRLLPLGDEVILCPAHGPGSACGGGSIADRPWTTVGLEKALDPLLALGEEEFVAQHARMNDFPPYFQEMERRNLQGARLPRGLPLPDPFDPQAFSDRVETSEILDIREVAAFGGALVPGSTFIYRTGLASFAGWFLPYDRPLLLVPDEGDRRSVVATLLRMGFDRLDGYLHGSLDAWYTTGLPTGQIECLTVEDACVRSQHDAQVWVLDVRSPEELETGGRIPDAANIPIRHLLEHLEEIPRHKNILIFCGSGRRSMVAASLLRARGWEDLSVVLGGIRGWKGAQLPVEA